MFYFSLTGISSSCYGPLICFLQVKWPNGKRFEDVFVDTLKKYGYRGSYLSKHWLKQPCFIQSFAPSSLVYISSKTDLPKIFLIGHTAWQTEDTKQVSNPSFSVFFFLFWGWGITCLYLPGYYNSLDDKMHLR